MRRAFTMTILIVGALELCSPLESTANISRVLPFVDIMLAMGLLTFIAMFLHVLPWIPLTLGTAIVLIAALLPLIITKKNKEEKGELLIKIKNIKFTLKGGIQFSLIACGIIIIICSFGEGFNEVKKMEQAREDGYFSPYRISSIGVEFAPSQIGDNAAVVLKVLSGSPADEQGILIGDTILSIDGVTAQGENNNWAYLAISKKKYNTQANLKVRRDKNILHFRVKRIDYFEHVLLSSDKFRRLVSGLETLDSLGVESGPAPVTSALTDTDFFKFLEFAEHAGHLSPHSVRKLSLLKRYGKNPTAEN